MRQVQVPLPGEWKFESWMGSNSCQARHVTKATVAALSGTI